MTDDDVPPQVLAAVRSAVDAVPTPRPATEDEHCCHYCPTCRERRIRERLAQREAAS